MGGDGWGPVTSREREVNSCRSPLINNSSLHRFQSRPPTERSGGARRPAASSPVCHPPPPFFLLHPPSPGGGGPDWESIMASKLSPNVLYVAEHGEELGSPPGDPERTHMVSAAEFCRHSQHTSLFDPRRRAGSQSRESEPGVRAADPAEPHLFLTSSREGLTLRKTSTSLHF